MFDDDGAMAHRPYTGLLAIRLRGAAEALAAASAAVSGRPIRELLDAVAECEALSTRAQLLQARVLAELPVDDRSTDNTVLPDAPLRREMVSPHEVALLLGVRVSTARDRLAVAQTVAAELPAVAAVGAEGDLKWWQVRRVAEAVSDLDATAIAMVDTRMAAAARAGRCRARFGPTLERVVIAAAPGLAEQRRQESLADRGIWFRAVGQGMSAFGGLLPAEGAVTLAACLTRWAGTPIAGPPLTCGPDGRTLDQARADALVGLADRFLDELLDPAPRPAGARAGAAAGGPVATGSSEPGSASRTAGRAARRTARRSMARDYSEAIRLADVLQRMTAAGLLAEADLGTDAPSCVDGLPVGRRVRPTGEIRVTVSAETLLGISSAPGELDGYGPITAAHARHLAHRAGTTWRRLLTDPTSGVVLDIGRSRYRPPQGLADLVATRYSGRCTRPGCPNRGRDLDHVRPWEAGGDTSDRNLHPTCRGCHTAKHSGWTVTLHDDVTVTWTAPNGHSLSTRPTDHRPEDRVVASPALAGRAGDPPPF